MSKTEFLGKLAEAIMAGNRPLKSEIPLNKFPGWDSMGQVAVVGLIDEALGISLPPGSLQNCRTVGDILALVADRLTD